MDTSKTQAALSAVLNFVATELKSRIKAFLTRAEETLHNSWQDIRVTDKRQRIRTAAEWLTQHKGWVETALYERLIQSLTDRRPPRDVDFTELRVLGDEAVGVIMMRAKLINQLMEQARYEVVSLEMRLDSLKQGGAKLNAKALGPSLIIDGFIGVLAELGASEDVQTLLLESYGDIGIALLIELYQNLNQLLVSYGVLPKFQIANVRPTNQNRDVSTAELAHLLESKLGRMQETLNKLPMSDWRPGQLREMLELPPPVHLNAVQQQSIDHIEALFIDLLNDQRISMRIRTELSRLILPTITLRLAAPKEFAGSDNPARVFVRQLALLGFRDEEAPLVDFGKIQIVVDRIVSEQGQDLSGFRTGAQVLYTLARNEVNRRLKAREQQRKTAVPAGTDSEPVPEQNEGTVANEQDTRELVLVELRELAAGLRIPPVVKNFTLLLLGPWMLAQLQQFGQESREWAEARSFADILFDVLRPAVNEDDRSRKRALRRYALLEARDRMQSAGMAHDMARDMLEELKQYLVSMDTLLEADASPEADRTDNSLDFLDDLASPNTGNIQD